MVFNFIAFQLFWWACVLAPKAALSGTVLLLMLAYALLHLRWVESFKHALPLFLTVLIGCLLDQLGYRWGLVSFPYSDLWAAWIPAWMMALWLAFATTLNVSMRWMQGKPLLAVVLGAIFGPVAYLGAQALGVVLLPLGTTSLLWISLEWAIAMPLMLWIRAHYRQRFIDVQPRT